MFSKLRIFEISVCRKGSLVNNVDVESCPICDKDNDTEYNEVVYYFPLRDRIRSLLISDLKRFLTYSTIRHRWANEPLG